MRLSDSNNRSKHWLPSIILKTVCNRRAVEVTCNETRVSFLSSQRGGPFMCQLHRWQYSRMQFFGWYQYNIYGHSVEWKFIVSSLTCQRTWNWISIILQLCDGTFVAVYSSVENFFLSSGNYFVIRIYPEGKSYSAYFQV